MLPGIFLFHRRRKKIVLRVIVDHCLGQDLVIAVALRRIELLIHESCDLIHVQVDIRDISRFDIIDAGEAFQDAVQYIIRIYCHIITSVYLLYSIENYMTSLSLNDS